MHSKLICTGIGACGRSLPRESFSDTQQKARHGQRLCSDCTNNIQRAQIEKHAMLICTGPGACGRSFPRAQFSKTQRHVKNGRRLCSHCINDNERERREKAIERHSKLTCTGSGGCGRSLPRDEFSESQRKKVKHKLCKDCVANLHQCGKCRLYFPVARFAKCQTATPSYMQTIQKRYCDTCLEKIDQKIQRLMQRKQRRTQERLKKMKKLGSQKRRRKD